MKANGDLSQYNSIVQCSKISVNGKLDWCDYGKMRYYIEVTFRNFHEKGHEFFI